jgi:uncharacterized protein DUF6249
MNSVLAVFFIFGTPALAIIGGILAGILKMRGQQRLLELAQRERIAAIEKGLNLAQLTPLPVPSPRHLGMRRAQGMTVGGLLTFFLGIGLLFGLWFHADGHDSWSIGFVPTFIGIGLMLAARIVRKGAESEFDV